jgi:hypothetical protein
MMSLDLGGMGETCGARLQAMRFPFSSIVVGDELRMWRRYLLSWVSSILSKLVSTRWGGSDACVSLLSGDTFLPL